MDDFDKTLLTILVTVNVTGAFIYSTLDPKGNNTWEEVQFDEDDYRVKEKTTIWNFLLSWACHSLFIFTWMIGLTNINLLKRKGMYFTSLKNDVRFLGRCVDMYLFSEIERMDEEDVEKQILHIERIINKYGIHITWLERDNPYDIKFKPEARLLFKRRIKLKIK